MIQLQSILKVADNSGAKTVKCIKVLGGYKKKTAYVGDIIVVSVQELRNRYKSTSKIKKGEVTTALIVRSKFQKKRKGGLFIRFDENNVVLLNKQLKFLGTKVLGVLPKELKKEKFLKLASISPGFF